jgi:5-hydroxyisourate hydrolase
MSTLSTHALDTASGKPAEGLPLLLEQQSDTEGWKQYQHQRIAGTLSEASSAPVWQELAQGITNSDGRCPELFSEGENQLEPGIYRMSFDTAHYFAKHKLTGFYPRVEVIFEIHHTDQHYHVPLLISPFGFSTYRGS